MSSSFHTAMILHLSSSASDIFGKQKMAGDAKNRTRDITILKMSTYVNTASWHDTHWRTLIR